MDQASNQGAALLERNKVMALHQTILKAIDRKKRAIDDAYWVQSSVIKRTLEIMQQLDDLVDDGCLQSKSYQDRFQQLVEHLPELDLYYFVAEEAERLWGAQARIFFNRD